MEHIGVFCSASGNISSKYFEATRQLGKWMGENRKTLIYGGSNLGLMECLAEAVKTNGGTVIGIAPAILEETERISKIPDEIIRTRDLSDRKDIIAQRSDILVALPGGLGTLDEVFHVMAAATIGYHKKKVVFYNIDGFYNDLLSFFGKLQNANFARRPIVDYYEVANTLDELTEILNK